MDPQQQQHYSGSFHIPPPSTPGKRGPKKGSGRGGGSSSSGSRQSHHQQQQQQLSASASSSSFSSVGTSVGGVGEGEGEYSFDLPRSNVARVIRRVIPEDYQLANDSKLAFSKAAVVFIMYLTATAQEQATKHKRSTLTADDVIDALDDLELGEYKDELVRTLNQYRQNQKVKKEKTTSKKKAKGGDDVEELN